MDFTSINLLFCHGFGFNTNILETNVINLAVVIAVVVSVVGDAVRELLKSRKETILSNLNEADKRASEALEKRNLAVEKLEQAKQKAKQIFDQAKISAEQEKALCISEAELEKKRMIQAKEDTINLYRQRAVDVITSQIVRLAIGKVRSKFVSQSTARFQWSVNHFKNAVLQHELQPKDASPGVPEPSKQS